MSATIRDIAEEANVSGATVSLVINRRPGVSMETRRRVIETAKRLNYKFLPQNTAPIDKTHTIRFLRIARHGQIVKLNTSVFFAEYIDGLENEAKANGWNLEVSYFDHFDFEAISRSINESSIAGVIVLCTELTDVKDITTFMSTSVPAVFIDTFQASVNVDSVDINNDSAVFSVVSHLKEQGHRDIGIVTSSIDTINFRLRERSFIQALEYHQLPFKEENVFTFDSINEKVRADMDALIKTRRKLPSALFCVADFLAYECMKALKANGISIPTDISIIGFDDLPAGAYMDPPLSSIRFSRRRLGQRAMQLLLQRIGNPDIPYEQVLIGSTLVKRESVRNMNAPEASFGS